MLVPFPFGKGNRESKQSGASGFAESFSNRAMEMIERVLVAPVNHFSDRAGLEAVLGDASGARMLIVTALSPTCAPDGKMR